MIALRSHARKVHKKKPSVRWYDCLYPYLYIFSNWCSFKKGGKSIKNWFFYLQRDGLLSFFSRAHELSLFLYYFCCLKLFSDVFCHFFQAKSIKKTQTAFFSYERPIFFLITQKIFWIFKNLIIIYDQERILCYSYDIFKNFLHVFGCMFHSFTIPVSFIHDSSSHPKDFSFGIYPISKVMNPSSLFSYSNPINLLS